MTGSWPDRVERCAIDALEPLRNSDRANGMAAYMKGVAPFLGITTPERRAALNSAWSTLPPPSSHDLGAAARALMGRREREYHYGAADLIDRYRRHANQEFLPAFMTELLTTTPWWDTVDALVSAAVSPLARRFPSDLLIDEWSESGDRWLVRAAITHQRGWRRSTDIPRVLALCDRHWEDREFFIAKAIGWALRDIARLDADGVQDFLDEHSTNNTTAIREARRGVERARGDAGS